MCRKGAPVAQRESCSSKQSAVRANFQLGRSALEEQRSKQASKKTRVSSCDERAGRASIVSGRAGAAAPLPLRPARLIFHATVQRCTEPAPSVCSSRSGRVSDVGSGGRARAAQALGPAGEWCNAAAHRLLETNALGLGYFSSLFGPSSRPNQWNFSIVSSCSDALIRELFHASARCLLVRHQPSCQPEFPRKRTKIVKICNFRASCV